MTLPYAVDFIDPLTRKNKTDSLIKERHETRYTNLCAKLAFMASNRFA